MNANQNKKAITKGTVRLSSPFGVNPSTIAPTAANNARRPNENIVKGNS
jgi:hypothetical protein